VLNAKGGESIRPKQKDHATTLFSKNVLSFKLVLLHLHKTLLAAKRRKNYFIPKERISLGGVFKWPKEKHLKKGRIFKS
jgi:hypothetical protein